MTDMTSARKRTVLPAWDSVIQLEAGHNLNQLRLGGIYAVSVPGAAPEIGDYFVEVIEGPVNGVHSVRQAIVDTQTGAEYIRVWVKHSGWSAWALRGNGGGGGGLGTDLTVGTRTATTMVVASSTGDDATLPEASTTEAGLFSADDKTKLDGIDAGAEVNVGTDLSVANKTATTLDLLSSTGNDATLPAATGTEAGLMTATDKAKLDGLGGTNIGIANKTATTLDVTSSSGTDATLPAATATEAGLMSAADKVALDAAAPGTLPTRTESTAITGIDGSPAQLVGVPKGNIILPGYESTGNQYNPLMPHLANVQMAWLIPRVNNTTVDGIAIGGTPSGTAGNRLPNPASATLLDHYKRVSYTSATTTNAAAGIRMNAMWLWRGSGTTGGFLTSITFGFTTAKSTTPRVFAGLSVTNGFITGSPVEDGLNMVGLGMDAADTNLYIYHNDGSGTATKVNLGANFPWDAGAIYELWLHCPRSDPTKIEYTVRRLDVYRLASGTLTTDLPGATNALGPQVSVGNGTTGEAVVMDFIMMTAQTDFIRAQP